MKNNNNPKFGCFGTLIGLLIAMKLCGIVDWSWITILTAPIWLELIVILIIIVLVISIAVDINERK